MTKPRQLCASKIWRYTVFQPIKSVLPYLLISISHSPFSILRFSFPILHYIPFAIPHSTILIPHSPFSIPSHSPFPILRFSFPIPHSPAPAIVDPCDNTTTDVAEDNFRYFQVECEAFSDQVCACMCMVNLPSFPGSTPPPPPPPPSFVSQKAGGGGGGGEPRNKAMVNLLVAIQCINLAYYSSAKGL